MPVLHPLEEEILEGVERGFAGKAIINILVILVCFEPEFVRVRKEQQAEEQEDDDKSEGGLGHFLFHYKSHDHKQQVDYSACQRGHVGDAIEIRVDPV